MNTVVRRKMEMAARVRDFIRAHPSEGKGYANALAHFEELLARAEALVAQQRGGLIADRASSARRRELRRALHFQLLRHLSGVGLVAGKNRIELASQLKLPRVRSNLAFLTAAKAMLASAEAEKELLIDQGMSETLLDDLGKAVSEFEAAGEASSAGRRDHVGASADLGTITRQIMEHMSLLDGLVRYRFGKDAELMAAWNSARNVPNPSRVGVAPKPSGDGTVPPSLGEVAPAA
jgi:hypothetical protein